MSDLREASLEPSTDKLPPAVLQAGPFAVLAACALWLVAKWDELPARIPVHWNIHGQPNRIVSRSSFAVALPFFIGAALCLLLLAFQVGMHRSAPRHRARAATIRILLGGEYLAAISSSAAVVATLTAGRLLVPILAACVLGALALVVATAISLRNMPRGGERNPGSWHGPFYADSTDPALFVPKRYGWGYTVNLAHRQAPLLLVATLLVPALALVFAFSAR